jgi:hypothetical protein
MKIKKYDDFVNEELTKDEKFILKNLPYILGNRLISHLLGAAPLLASKWQALKNTSKGEWSHYGGTSHNLIKRNLTKIEISDLPDTPLKRGLYPFFNKWNIYKSDETSTGGVSKGHERPVIYISKDELKTGDYVVSSREGSWETEEEGTYKTKSGKILRKNRKANENDPIFILAAKYEIDEYLHNDFKEDIKDYLEYDIKDDDLFVSNINTSLENDSIHCIIKSKDKNFLSEKIINAIEIGTKRSIKSLNEKWTYSISFSSGEFGINKDNQSKILDQYQKDPNFWDNLSKYNLYSDDRSDSLKRLYIGKNKEYVIEELFGNGKYRNVKLINKSVEIIKASELTNQAFKEIYVNFSKL